MASRQYVVDVAAYQNASLAAYHNAGAKAVFVKLTEGTGYFNPKATAQVRSAHAHNITFEIRLNYRTCTYTLITLLPLAVL